MMSVDIKCHKTVSSAIANENIKYSPIVKNQMEKQIGKREFQINQPSFLDEQGYQTVIKAIEDENYDAGSTYKLASNIHSIFNQINIPVLPPKTRRNLKIIIKKKSRAKPTLFKDEWEDFSFD